MQFDRKKISQENKTMKIAYSIKMRFTACYNKVAISKKLGTAQELSKMEKQVPRWYLSQMSRYLSNVDGSKMVRVLWFNIAFTPCTEILGFNLYYCKRRGYIIY